MRRTAMPVDAILLVRSYAWVTAKKFHSLWATAGAIAALSGCATQSVAGPDHFVAVDEQKHLVATVLLEQPLASFDTSLTFAGPPGPGPSASIVLPMKFEVAGAFLCLRSSLIVICRTAEHAPPQARTEDGSYVRRLNTDTILVSDTPEGFAGDFARFRNQRLIAFGVMDDAGAEAWRYDLQ